VLSPDAGAPVAPQLPAVQVATHEVPSWGVQPWLHAALQVLLDGMEPEQLQIALSEESRAAPGGPLQSVPQHSEHIT
jgi:hypothetical protein